MTLDPTQDHVEAHPSHHRGFERVTVCTSHGAAYLTRECCDKYPDLLKGMVMQVLELELAV